MAWSPDGEALRGRVAVVAGATRGAGRGIAAALGEAGATVICTGRASRAGGVPSGYHRAETIEGTGGGGRGRAVRLRPRRDHRGDGRAGHRAGRDRDPRGRRPPRRRPGGGAGG